MAREKLPEAPAVYNKADQDRTRRIIERGLAQPPAAGTIESGAIDPGVLKVVRVVETRTTGSLGSGNSETGVLDIKTPSTMLILLEVNKRCWLRFYATQAASDADSTRPRTTDPLAGSGVIGEFIINADLVNVVMRVAPVLIFYDGNVPTGTVVRYRITNDEAGTNTITFKLTVIELETDTA